jgi:hypothetical protein
MVKRSILFTLLLLVLYGGYISLFKVSPESQQQFQMNTVKEENYMYTDSLKNADVILGTSMAAKIRVDMLPKNIYSLALGGQSVLDGIDLVENAGGHPKYVFIEQNSIMSPERPGLIKYLFNAPNYYRKKYLPFMRDNYQPAGQLYKAILKPGYSGIHAFTRHIFNPTLNAIHKGRLNTVSKDEFYAEAKMHRSKVDTELVLQSFVNLKVRVSELEKTGARICFFLMPNDKEVDTSPVAKFIHKEFAIYFPPSVYTWLPRSDLTQFHTIDQIHLDDTSAVKYTRELAQKIEAVRHPLK